MPDNIHIHIPNTEKGIPVCSSAVKEFATLIGLKKKDVHRIVLVTEEILQKVITNSYLAGQSDEIILMLLKTKEGIKIKISNHGIPFDTDKINSETPGEEHEFSKLRIFALKLVDNIRFEAKGYEGNEIVFEKYFIPKKEKKPIIKIEQHEELKTETVKHEYYVRFLKQDEANDVSKLAYTAYHYSYPHELIYVPNDIKEKISVNEMLSAVAVLNNTNKIISHTALLLPHENAKSAEMGIAFTDPNFRGYGCINKIWTFLIDNVAVKKNLFGVFAMAVTSHPYSQKACHKMGLVDIALFISCLPILGFEKIEIGGHQRESTMIAFIIMNPVEKVVFYPPKNHRKMILEITEQMGINVVIGKHLHLNLNIHHNYSNLEIEKDKDFQIANIIITQIGKDLKSAFSKEFESLKTQRFETIYLYLDLANFHTEKITSQFEKQGFFFAGIHHKNNRMNLVLQYLNNQTYNFDSLKIASDFGKNLTEYVKQEFEKTY